MKPEERFFEENGMTVEEAMQMVYSWEADGEYDRAKTGAEEILKFLPNHEEAKAFLHAPKKEMKGVLSTLNDATKQIQERQVEKAQERLPTMELPEQDERLVAVLCYAWMLVILPLILKRNSSFVQFHAWQGLTLTLLVFVFNTFIVSIIEFLEPLSGFFGFLKILVQLTIFAVYLWGAFMAYQGKWFRLPGLAPFAEKLQKLFS